MDERLIREFWRMMEDRNVNEFLLAVFKECVKKARRRNYGIVGAKDPVKPLYFSFSFSGAQSSGETYILRSPRRCHTRF
jgi:hypothetical protein